MVQQETAITVEVVEELTEDELADRHRLELKVERAFYEAGKALTELRDRRLYRSTHRTFEEYCRARFGFQRRHSYRLIDAAAIVDNLCPIGTHENLGTNQTQVLPTNERQVRDLIGLEPYEQRFVWEKAIEAAGGKVPSGRIVKGFVERLKERDTIPPSIPYQFGDVFLISAKAGELKKYSGCWAIALQINEYTISVRIHDGDFLVKPENLEPIDSPSEAEEIRAIARRIWRLRQCGLLDRGAYYVLEGLGRQTSLTPLEAKLLAVLEQEYGLE